MYIAFPDKKPVCLDDVAITEGPDAYGLLVPDLALQGFLADWLTG